MVWARSWSHLCKLETQEAGQSQRWHFSEEHGVFGRHIVLRQIHAQRVSRRWRRRLSVWSRKKARQVQAERHGDRVINVSFSDVFKYRCQSLLANRGGDAGCVLKRTQDTCHVTAPPARRQNAWLLRDRKQGVSRAWASRGPDPGAVHEAQCRWCFDQTSAQDRLTALVRSWFSPHLAHCPPRHQARQHHGVRCRSIDKAHRLQRLAQLRPWPWDEGQDWHSRMECSRNAEVCSLRWKMRPLGRRLYSVLSLHVLAARQLLRYSLWIHPELYRQISKGKNRRACQSPRSHHKTTWDRPPTASVKQRSHLTCICHVHMKFSLQPQK